ncbi:hypothetical protein VP01_1836g3 [Puccinia sorghi]|uniref:Uncharacterized protein n=1 Tax=Puccinia sorghi TaxID=27349 RepID=A0A0L6VEC7_9BASI|nr:hypothetical protein VP01_1836g3 [Puccinia sorghi]
MRQEVKFKNIKSHQDHQSFLSLSTLQISPVTKGLKLISKNTPFTSCSHMPLLCFSIRKLFSSTLINLQIQHNQILIFDLKTQINSFYSLLNFPNSSFFLFFSIFPFPHSQSSFINYSALRIHQVNYLPGEIQPIIQEHYNSTNHVLSVYFFSFPSLLLMSSLSLSFMSSCVELLVVLFYSLFFLSFLISLFSIDMQHALAKLPSQLHLFAYVDVLAQIVHQGKTLSTSLSSAIPYLLDIFGLKHVACWLHVTHIYAAKINMHISFRTQKYLFHKSRGAAGQTSFLPLGDSPPNTSWYAGLHAAVSEFLPAHAAHLFRFLRSRLEHFDSNTPYSACSQSILASHLRSQSAASQQTCGDPSLSSLLLSLFSLLILFLWCLLLRVFGGLCCLFCISVFSCFLSFLFVSYLTEILSLVLPEKFLCRPIDLSCQKKKATCMHCLVRYKGAPLYLARQCVPISFTLGLVIGITFLPTICTFSQCPLSSTARHKLSHLTQPSWAKWMIRARDPENWMRRSVSAARRVPGSHVLFCMWLWNVLAHVDTPNNDIMLC